MARRKQLKGISGNLAHWCISRNFDSEGYWAIGQLYSFAKERRTNEISLNLKNKIITPTPEKGRFTLAVNLLVAVFLNDLESNETPKEWLSEANITFKFNTEYQHKYHLWGLATGEPFVCSVSIKTDLGKIYINESGCNVWPHNPKKEQRRYGF